MISPVPLEKDFQRVTQIMVIHLVGPYAVETDLGIDGHHEIEHRRKRPASGIRGGQCLVGDACLAIGRFPPRSRMLDAVSNPAMQ